MSDIVSVSPAVRESFAPILAVLERARADLAPQPDVAAVRPGYKYHPGGAPEPALIVAVTPGTQPVTEGALSAKYGVTVVVEDATVEEQMARLTSAAPVSFATPAGPTASAFETLISGEAIIAFAPPKSGTYEPPEPPNLPLVEEAMELTVCVSPEAGWSELETFLGATQAEPDRGDVSVHRAAYLQSRERCGDPRGTQVRAGAPPHPRTSRAFRREGERSRGAVRRDRSPGSGDARPVRDGLGHATDESPSRRIVGLRLSHQGRRPRRLGDVAVERQLAVDEPARRPSLRARR